MKRLNDFQLDQFTMKVLSRVGGTLTSQQFAKIEEMASAGKSIKDTAKTIKGM